MGVTVGLESNALRQGHLEQSTLVRCFEAQANEHSARLAVCSNASELTYAQLNALANLQAHALLARKVELGQPIAVLLDQGIPFISAMLAILKAGGCFVPLDPNNPTARNARMLQATGCRWLVTNQRNISLARTIVADGCELLEVDGLPQDARRDNPEVSISCDTLACVLFTSGSTGEPKGVMHDHGSLLHNANRHHSAFRITADDRQTLLYTCSVYGGVRDIFNALLNGASLHTFPVRQRGVEGMAEWLRASRITIYCSVATVFRQFVATLTAREQFPNLRLIKLGGEASNRTDVELFRAHFPATCLLHCGLGITETGVVRHFFIDHETKFDGDAVPLGYPVDDVQVLLLDEQGAPVRQSEIGEIVVRSRYIARGYWRRPDLNDVAFASDTLDARIRTYRTGDLGVLRADGLLEHRGRKDSQVKIRGNRIELAEIETALRRSAAVAHAAVVVRRDRHNETYLVAYIVAGGEHSTVSALRKALSERLPDHMIPSIFVLLDNLPQTSNGKIDRQALSALETTRPHLAEHYIAPQNAMESNIAALWSELLGIEGVGVLDDFFELGGNSLAALQLMTKIRAQHGRTLPLSLLFEARTVRRLADVVARGHEQSSWSPLVPIQPRGRRAPLFCIHPGGGNVLGYQEFIAHLDPDQPVYGIQGFGVVEGQDPHTSVQVMAREYMKLIREVQPHGDYYLGGESFGGLVAYEMACQLTREGERVAFLFLGDVWSIAAPQFRRWRYALAWLTYPLTLSLRDWRLGLTRKFLGRRTSQILTKRYAYADDLHRRNSIAHRQASHRYSPGRYSGKLTLFRAREQDHHTRRLQHYFGGPQMGWQAFVNGQVEVHWMPDVHREMMHGANARGFARTLQRCIDSANTSADKQFSQRK